MANIPTITKQNVTESSGGIFAVSVSFVVNDGTSDIIDTSVSARYDSNAPDLASVQATLQQKIQNIWDKHVSEQNKLNSAALDTIVSNIQTAADAYIS